MPRRSADEDGSYRVFWRVGGRVGCINIMLEPDRPLSDLDAAAELAAIQLLLSEKEVMGANRTGKGLILDVSRGAIRKLHNGTSAKKDLTPYAAFLVTRYHEAKITVAKKAPWIPDTLDEIEQDDLLVDGPRYESVETPCMGRVTVTVHAIEQYEERFSEGELSRTWTSLVKRMQNAELKTVELPEKVKKHKKSQYGNRPTAVWRHPNGTLHFVVVDNPDGSRTLVTVYYRSDTKLARSSVQ